MFFLIFFSAQLLILLHGRDGGTLANTTCLQVPGCLINTSADRHTHMGTFMSRWISCLVQKQSKKYSIQKTIDSHSRHRTLNPTSIFKILLFNSSTYTKGHNYLKTLFLENAVYIISKNVVAN